MTTDAHRNSRLPACPFFRSVTHRAMSACATDCGGRFVGVPNGQCGAEVVARLSVRALVKP
jgi:hypothetical protein